ncbi:MAG: OpgC domain-containing protein [Gammaproteobacteria bacterium]|nr:OpgC domain-containing protein [Gammaproteobacteria bacterium]
MSDDTAPRAPRPLRDLRIDSLRGLMLAEITLVHSGCPLGRLSNEMFGRVSAAAGFVFLSGLVAGAVYGRTAERGAAAITLRCLKRSLYIETYHVAAFLPLLLVLLLEPRVNEHFRIAVAPVLPDALRVLGDFALWAYQPMYFDILPMYAVFVLLMPLALLALREGHGLGLLLVSLGLWGCAQAGLGSHAAGGEPFGFFRGEFNPFAWQFVFFSGLYFGYRHLYRKQPVVTVQPRLIVLCALICAAGLTMRWGLLPWPAVLARGGWLAAKTNYGAAYLLNFLAFAYLIYCLARRFPGAFTWPPLAFLGRHSIQVFYFHLVIVYMAGPLRWRAAAYGPLVYDAFGAALVSTLFIPAWCHERWRAWRGAGRIISASMSRSEAT